MFHRIRAWYERLMSPGLSWCKRCRRPWSKVDGHSTPYSKGSGCFPLCESCWKQLTPPERLPFYRQLWEIWECDCQENDVPWSVFRAACLLERDYEPVESLEAGLELLAARPDLYEYVCGIGPYQMKPALPPEVVEAWGNHRKEPNRAGA